MTKYPDEPPYFLCNKCGGLVQFDLDGEGDFVTKEGRVRLNTDYSYWCQGCKHWLDSSNVRLDPERKQLTIGVD